MTSACTYCSQNVAEHDPVFVEELEAGNRVEAGQFCNYACLTSYIEENHLTTGAACAWTPSSAN
ncbi:hypothetical protein [Haladaptatus sp. DJG-WS-42]|uniref:hypothetical protein n=1 Tax=Haladaptatus sp. DJG-WS-42 TaxID=3120516 RepID=UPI0030D1D7B1